MATYGNSDVRGGVRPLKMVGGAPYNGAVFQCHIPSTYATATYLYDVVKSTGTATGSNGGPVCMEVNNAAATNTVLGSVISISPNASTPNKVYRSASTNGYVLVADLRGVVCYAQADGAMAVTDVGAMTDLVTTHGGSTVTNLSGMEVNSTSQASAATFHILGLLQHPDSPLMTDSWPKLEVRVNESELGDGAAGT